MTDDWLTELANASRLAAESKYGGERPRTDPTRQHIKPGDVIRIKVGVEWDRFVRSRHEKTVTIPRTDWEEMDVEERAAFLDDEREGMLADEVRTWAYVEGEG